MGTRCKTRFKKRPPGAYLESDCCLLNGSVFGLGISLRDSLDNGRPFVRYVQLHYLGNGDG
jgi:hypothetical protein